METAATQIARQLAQLKVLIVDDEPSMRKVTRALLQAIGVKTSTRPMTAAAALKRSAPHAPDVVILDWEMPSPNGPEFMRTVRAPDIFPLPDIPVIMLTGHSERSCVIEAMRLGVNEYLIKPVSSIALLARARVDPVQAAPDDEEGRLLRAEPRKLAGYKPDADPGYSHIVLVN